MSLERNKKSLQEIFLNELQKNSLPVTLFLMNGIKLQGIVTEFDNFVVFLQKNNQLQLVYKHSISTIMPVDSFSLFQRENITEQERI
jgi:host factor-I protein